MPIMIEHCVDIPQLEMTPRFIRTRYQPVVFQITDRAGNLGQSEPVTIRFAKAQQIFLPLVTRFC